MKNGHSIVVLYRLPKPATVALLYSETSSSRPLAAAALAIPDLAALIFSPLDKSEASKPLTKN
jgi:hypothetical protein